MLFGILRLYLIIGVLVWGSQLASDVYDNATKSQPTCAEGDATTISQVPGFNASGFLQIVMWAPSLIQAVRHGMPATELVRPTECVAKGSIEFGSTRCECDAPLIHNEKVLQFYKVHYWAKTGVACDGAKPPACSK